MIIRICLAGLFVLSLITSGYTKPKSIDDVQPFPYESHYVNFANPEPLGLVGNPLDYAGKRIGLDVRNVELPRGWEGRYRYACRFPIIDYVSTNPLYMKQWTEDTAERLIKEHSDNGIKTVNYALELLAGSPIEMDYLESAISGESGRQVKTTSA